MWSDLTMSQKADIMRIAIQNGMTDLNDIRSNYNEFAEGGDLENGETEPTQQMDTGKILNHDYQNDVFTGATFPGWTVTRRKDKTYFNLGEPIEKKKQKPYFVSSRTGQLTIGDAMKGIDAAVGPVLHWMQPSQYVGAFRDATEGKNPINSMLRGNSGVVSEEFEKSNPLLSTVLNLSTDAVTLGGLSNASRISGVVEKSANKGRRFFLDIDDRYQGMKDATAYKNTNGNTDARTISNINWWQNGGTPIGINKMGINNIGDFGTYYYKNPEILSEGYWYSPVIEKGGNMTLTAHLGGDFPGELSKDILPMSKSEKIALTKYVGGVPEHTYLGEVGRTKNYAEQYFNTRPSRLKAFKDAVRNKKEANEPYWNEEEHVADFMNEENPIERAYYQHMYDANEPLSTDSYKLILQEAAKDNGKFALRYDSSPMGMFNPQGSYERTFYESLQSLTPKEQVKTINKWMKHWYPKARPAYLENNEIQIPRPLLLKK